MRWHISKHIKDTRYIYLKQRGNIELNEKILPVWSNNICTYIYVMRYQKVYDKKAAKVWLSNLMKYGKFHKSRIYKYTISRIFHFMLKFLLYFILQIHLGNGKELAHKALLLKTTYYIRCACHIQIYLQCLWIYEFILTNGTCSKIFVTKNEMKQFPKSKSARCEASIFIMIYLLSCFFISE